MNGRSKQSFNTSKYTFSVPDPDGKQFSSTVDFLIHVREDRAVLIVEVGFLSEWSEPQIAGEIFQGNIRL